MLTLWIGDFRTEQLKNLNATSGQNAYLTGNTVEYSWFEAQANSKLLAMSDSSANVIISMGFYDCLFSCVWPDAFNVETIASNYKTIIDSFVNDYPSYNFYVCAPGPVDGDYQYSRADGGKIKQKDLNSKIKSFGSAIKKSKATYIDCYDYLATTGFKTRDGIRYTSDTCLYLVDYIKSQMDIAISYAAYSSVEGLNVINRCAESGEPDYSKIINGSNRGNAPDSAEESWKYYTTDNIYYKSFDEYGNRNGLPNCTAYALGRFKEYSNGVNCEDLGIYGGYGGMACNWYLAEKKRGKYHTGSSPAVGAVVCWKYHAASDGRTPGHVAIVEYVSDDGSYMIISEGAWRDVNNIQVPYDPNKQCCDGWHFNIRKIPKDNDKWTYGASYTLEGFIYNPNLRSSSDSSSDNDTDASVSSNNYSLINYVDKSNVFCEHSYLADSEMLENAKYIWNYFGTRGWTLNAVAGMLGNMQKESTINPALMELRTEETRDGRYIGVPSWPDQFDLSKESIEAYVKEYYDKKGRFPGIGLTQWTSSKITEWKNHKLVKWCTSNGLDYLDIDSQLKRISYECENGLQFSSTKDYPMTFKEFSTSKLPAGYLAKAFVRNYERPEDPDYELREKWGEEWFQKLLPYAAVDGALMTLNGIKIKSVNTTSAELSCIARKCSKYTYVVTDPQGKEVYTKTNFLNNSEYGEVATFSIPNLIPATNYLVTITTFGETDSDQLMSSIAFTTKQSYPSSIKNIKIAQTDSDILDPTFEVKFENNIDWGYWSTSEHGYTAQLFVNGCCKHTRDINIAGNTLTITPKSYFSGYVPKVGDVLQIGLRTWTTNASNERLLDSGEETVSNAIAMMSKPVTLYLKA